MSIFSIAAALIFLAQGNDFVALQYADQIWAPFKGIATPVSLFSLVLLRRASAVSTTSRGLTLSFRAGAKNVLPEFLPMIVHHKNIDHEARPFNSLTVVVVQGPTHPLHESKNANLWFELSELIIGRV